MHDDSKLNGPDVAAGLITDVWFRTPLPLSNIAAHLGLRDVVDDAENYWAWVLGRLGDFRLDVTRTHTKASSKSDTRIFLVDRQTFTPPFLQELVGLLRTFVAGPIWCGRWEYRSGNDFEKIVVEEFAPSAGTKRR
jgi:hypothetical protein